MVGTIKVTGEQWDLLLAFMEEHPDLARGTQTNDGPHAKIAASNRWAELARALNCMGSGCNKTATEWRIYWKRYRCEVRKKASERRTQGLATGGGPLPRNVILTDREERILALLGNVAVFGMEQSRIPFPREIEERIDEPNPPGPISEATLELELRPPAFPPPNLATIPSASQTEAAAPAAPSTPPRRPNESSSSAASPVISTPGSTPDARRRQTQNPRASRQRRHATRRVIPDRNNHPCPAVSIPPPDWALELERERLKIEKSRLRHEANLVEIGNKMVRATEALVSQVSALVERVDTFIETKKE